MKKMIIPSVAIVATLAIGGVAVAGGGSDNKGDKAKFDTAVTLSYNQGPYDPYDPYYEEAVFSGTVTPTPANKAARKSENGLQKCTKKRTVLIKNLDLPKGLRAYGSVKTDNTGFYSVTASDEYAEDGTYRAKVTKKSKVAAEIKCFGGKSNEVEVSTPDDG